MVVLRMVSRWRHAGMAHFTIRHPAVSEDLQQPASTKQACASMLRVVLHAQARRMQSCVFHAVLAIRVQAIKSQLAALERTKDDELEQILTVSCAAEERAQHELAKLRDQVSNLQQQDFGEDEPVELGVVQSMEEEIRSLRKELEATKRVKAGLAARLEHALASPSPSPYKADTMSPLNHKHDMVCSDIS